MLTKIRASLRSQKGFTLVELMAVIAIIGILAAIAVPRFANATTDANVAKAQADLRTIDSAVSMYRAANSTAPTTANLVPTYLAAWPKSPSNNATPYTLGIAADGYPALWGAITSASDKSAFETKVKAGD